MSIKYFGIETTYNPFSNAEDLQQVSNAIFSITDEPNFATTYAVSVSTGLVPTAISFLSADFSATILNADGTTLLQILKAKIGSIGNNEYPQVDEIVWFDVEGMQSAFWIHSDYNGKKLKISGKFQTTALTAESLIALIEKADKVGTIMAWAGSFASIPSYALLCDGRELSRASYSNLFKKLGTAWGRGNGSTTFNIPDGRAGVLKGVGSSSKYSYYEYRGSVGSYQNTAIINIYGTIYGSYGFTNAGTSGAFESYAPWPRPRLDGPTDSVSRVNFNASRVVPTGTTNRDNNLGIYWIIFI